MSLNSIMKMVLSGNLCNDTIEPVNGALNTSNNKRKAENGKTSVAINQTTSTYVEDHDTVDSGPTITANTSQFVALVPTRVSKTDRNKFCGSLPNHLDTDDVCEENGKSIQVSNFYNGFVFVFWVGGSLIVCILIASYSFKNSINGTIASFSIQSSHHR